MPKPSAPQRSILYAIALVVCIMLAISITGFYRIHLLASELDHIIEQQEAQAAQMYLMRQAAQERSLHLQSMLITRDPFIVDELTIEMWAASNRYIESRSTLLSLQLGEQEHSLLTSQQEHTRHTASLHNQILNLLREGDYEAASQIMLEEALPSQRRAMALMDEFVALKRQQNLDTLQETTQTIRQTYTFMLLLGVLGILLSIAIALGVSRRIAREIHRRQRTEQELREFQHVLEQRVQERTQALEETNQKLRHEIDERITIQHELVHLANHDPLTQLPNRAYFSEQLDIVLHHARRHQHIVGLLFLDLDGFKAINDNHGHHVGDQALIEVAGRMSQALRREDMVARMGGDEFTVLLCEIAQPEDATMVAQKLLEEISKPLVIGSHICHLGASIGIAIFPYNAEDTDTLLSLADDAMYAAKESGKNSWCVSASCAVTPAGKRITPS